MIFSVIQILRERNIEELLIGPSDSTASLLGNKNQFEQADDRSSAALLPGLVR